VDFIFVLFSGLILTGIFSLQKSLGDIIGDEADASAQVKGKPGADKKKKSFLRKRKS